MFLCDSFLPLSTSLLFLTDHGFRNYFYYAFCIFFTLAFGTQYIVYKFRYGLLSNFEYIVGLESYLPIVEEKFCLQINPSTNKIFFEVVFEFYTLFFCIEQEE